MTEEELMTGFTVYHRKFGVGFIEQVDGNVVTVDFVNGEERRIYRDHLSATPFDEEQLVDGRMIDLDRRYSDVPPEPPPIAATPFVWRDPQSIPRRRFLYGRHYARQFMSTTLAPGGVGKSSLVKVELLSMATRRPLLGVEPDERCRVWLWNGEDPLEEIERRLVAACLLYGVDPDEIAGRFFIDSGRSTQIIVASQTKSGITIAQPVVNQLVATIRENGIDCVCIDPFISSHAVGENDNMAIGHVAKTWAAIADQTGCAVELVHHVRKTQPGMEITIEDGRGAVALINASRSARVLNPMSEAEAAKLAVENRRLHFRVDNGKASMSAPPPTDKAHWFKMASVDLGNGPLGIGDNVGVVTAWTPPDPMNGIGAGDLLAAQQAIASGRFRENTQAKDWVGRAIAGALRLDLDLLADKAKVKMLIKTWVGSGALVIVQDRDDKGNQRPFIEVGEWADQ